MPTPKLAARKLQSQTRSTKTKATHPDPVIADAKPGIGKLPMNFERRAPVVQICSWWVDAAQPEQRALFITLAHQRNADMLAADNHIWRTIERLHHIGEV